MSGSSLSGPGVGTVTPRPHGDTAARQQIIAQQGVPPPTATFEALEGLLRELIQVEGNPPINATIDRGGVRLSITQANRTSPISIGLSPSGQRPSRPRSFVPAQFTYHPKGRIEIQEGSQHRSFASSATLDRVERQNHELTFTMLSSRMIHQNNAYLAYSAIAGILPQIQSQSSSLQGNPKYARIAVVGQQAVTLETPPPRSLDHKVPITVHLETPTGVETSFTLSPRGSLGKTSPGQAHQLPTQDQLHMLRSIGTHLDMAHRDPAGYQTRLSRELIKAGFSSNTTPTIAHSIAYGRRPQTFHSSYEATSELKSPGEIWEALWYKEIRLGKSYYWVKPTRAIRRRMFREMLRSQGIRTWHGMMHSWREGVPAPGYLKLSYQDRGPDRPLGQSLALYRRIGGATAARRPELWDILQTTVSGQTIHVGKVATNLARGKPDLASLSRHEQLDHALAWLHDNHGLSDIFLQRVPRLDFQHLSPRRAEQAYEAIETILRESGIQYRGQGIQERIAGRETRFTIEIPNSDPLTVIEVAEPPIEIPHGDPRETRRHPFRRLKRVGSHLGLGSTSGSGRVIIRMWQGGAQTDTYVFNDGVLDRNNSMRLAEEPMRLARYGYHTVPKWKAAINHLARARFSPLVHGAHYAAGYLTSLPVAWAYENLAWTKAQRDILGTPVPTPTLKGLAFEGAALGVMTASAGVSTLVVDGAFNYGGGLYDVLQTWRYSRSSLGTVYANQRPRIFNPRVHVRPLAPQAFHLRHVSQRAIPLTVSLTALDALVYGEVNMNRVLENTYKVGSVSLATTGLWSAVGHHVENKLLRRATGQSLTGLAGFLRSRRLLVNVPSGVGGARLGLSWRANLLTVALEMAVLAIWESSDRKSKFEEQEYSLRHRLARAVDRLNGMTTLLERREYVAPSEIRGAYEEMKSAYRQYYNFLKIMERSSQDPDEYPKPLSLENRYAHADSFELIRLKKRDQEFQKELRKLQSSFGITTPKNYAQENLADFAKALLQDSTKPKEKTKPSPSISMKSPIGKTLVRHFQEELNRDPDFFNQPMEKIARQTREYFSGWDWSQEEILTFLKELLAENQRRIDNFREPLLAPKVHEVDAEKWIRFGQAEADLYRRYESDNFALSAQEQKLSRYPSDLQDQIKNYERRIGERLAVALAPYLLSPEPALSRTIQVKL